MARSAKLGLLLGAALGVITALVAVFAPMTGLRGSFESASADVAYSSEVYVANANFPTALQFSSDGRLFYNERCGSVRIVTAAGALLPTPFVTLTDVACSGDYALVGLALDPDFQTNHYVYVFYMQLLSQSPYIAKPLLMRFTEVNNLGTNPTVILGDLSETIPDNLRQHGADNIHFGPDGKLYVSLGDLAKDATQSAQDLTIPEGKILRINSDGSVPLDNPFVGDPGVDERIFAYGFRNTFDFTFHPDDGRIYATENGTNKCDELNIVTAGQNYGWPFLYEGAADIWGEAVSCDVAVGTQPMYWFRFFEWMDPWSINTTSAPTGIIFIDGDEHPLLGDSLLACEFRSRKLRHIVLNETHDAMIAEPWILEDDESCELGITLAPNGDIYYSNVTSIRRLVITGPTPIPTPTLSPTATATATPSPTPVPTATPDPGSDTDADGFTFVVETACGSDPSNGSSIPERVDGIFASVDDDANDGADEALPSGAGAVDCDGDGYTGDAEDHVFSYVPQTDGDQKTCRQYDLTHPNPGANINPSLRWPSDFNNATSPLNSFNKITILDLTSFIVPIKYFRTDVGTNPGDVRWDLVPGSGVFSEDINIEDLVALIAGASGAPPMLGNVRATNGPECPWPEIPPSVGDYEVVQVLPVADFSQMIDLEPIPGSEDVAVATKTGDIWRVPLSGGAATLMGDVSSLLPASPAIDEGLLALAFSPTFESDDEIYLHYTVHSPRRSVFSRFAIVSSTISLASEEIIIEVNQPGTNHNGGKIAFGDDDYLYIPLGDGGFQNDPSGHGQNLGTHLSAMLRLDVSGSGAGYVVPLDNPFIDTPGALPEIWAYGFRNPWRFSFDSLTGVPWVGDVGQDTWEEVEPVVSGGNYGWNVMEGFACFNPSVGCDMSGKELPRAAYDHGLGCSVTGGYVYRGSAMPELYGWYVYADFCTGRIWGVDTIGAAAPVELTDTALNPVSFGQLPDGELVILTFANALYQLQRIP